MIGIEVREVGRARLGRNLKTMKLGKNSMMIFLPSHPPLLSVSFTKLNSIDFILSAIDDH